jgi:cytochrome c553
MDKNQNDRTKTATVFAANYVRNAMSCFRPIILAATVFAVASLAVADVPSPDAASQPTAAQLEFFEKKVRPIFVAHCHKCHGTKKQEGELRLDSRAGLLKGGESGPVVKPGEPQQSELIAAINYGADSFQMPPDGKLKPADIAALTAWVKMGAPWTKSKTVGPTQTKGNEFDFAGRAKHWSFQPVQRPGIPTVTNGGWARNPIDRFVLARLEQAGLRPAREANKRTLLRRLSYDLTGLPPTVDELHEFIADDSPSAYERAVDRLLASPGYGERWARHWLDLVRFAETGGHEFDFEIPNAWPYRDYVVRAFAHDVPYNEFVIEHIAGDLVETPRKRASNGDNESVIGTAFYWFSQGKHSPVDIRSEECDTIDNQLDVLGKTFLGLTVACARCHDHKFDPIRARDYYALAGYLQSSRRQQAILNDPAVAQSIIDQIAKVTDDNRRTIEQFEAGALLGQTDRLIALMQETTGIDDASLTAWQKRLKETSARNPADLFHAWAMLNKQLTPQQFAASRNALVKRLRDLNKTANSRAGVFADFNAGSYRDWFVSGPAFGPAPSRNGDLVWREQPSQHGSVVAEILPAGWAHSGLIAGRLEGTMRSSTFTIDRRYIHYRARRIGGRPNPGRAVKNGQLHLIVDGFQYIKNPLHGGLTINVVNDGQWRWYRHDVIKLLGSRAYIEIDDEDAGSIVIDRVLFSDAGPPADKPNALIIDMLDDAAVTTAEQLADGYRQLFASSLMLWKEGRLRAAKDSAARIALVNWLLQNRSLFVAANQKTPVDRNIAGIVAMYRAVATQLTPPRRSVAMIDGSGENDHVLIRGNHKRPGKTVIRRSLEVLAGVDQPEPKTGSGRMQLAQSLADPSNPLTARVMVNRLWLHHFGRGIVASPDNFGLQGKPPSHPLLLDWLAGEFVDGGWSIKQMHRLMVTSNTYRMSSRAENARFEQLNPQNILLHRMNIKRLEGEAIRDGLLAISGRLDERRYGPGVMPHLTPFMEGRGRPRRSGPLDGDGRRSVYISVRRNFLTPLFLAFDLPSPSSTIGRRSVSNVPAQALTMMNNPFVIQQAGLWSSRTLEDLQANDGRPSAESNNDLTRQRIRRLYETAFSRLPTDDEFTATLGFLTEQGKEYNGPNDPRTWADLCHVLLNVKEFVFVN